MEENHQPELPNQPAGFQTLEIIKTSIEQKVLLKGRVYMRWQEEDQIAPRVAMVQLYESGIANQEKLAELFGIHVRSVRNYVSAFRLEGISGLMAQPKGPREAWKITTETRFKILQVAFRHKDIPYEKIADVLKKQWNVEVSLSSIRQVLMENGFIEEHIKTAVDQPEADLFTKKSAQLEMEFKGENHKLTVMGVERTDEKNRERRDRSYYSPAERVYLDQLEGGQFSAYAGGFLFAPLLRQYHYLERIKESIPIQEHERYSLEQLSLTLFYFDLFGYRSIENFKTVYPDEFGILIGRSKSPSIYTLRRFLHRVRVLKKGEELIEGFGKEYLKSGLVKWGILYIDGHFVPYYGQDPITMGWHGVQEKAMKGSYQFLAVDEMFNPLIFFLRPSSDDLLEMIPDMVEKARRMAKELGQESEDVTVIFDREGYSAELFRKLNDRKIKFITWAKYMDRWVNDYEESELNERVVVEYEIQKGEEIRYVDTSRTMNKYGNIRTLVIENEGSEKKKRRAALYTNDDKTNGGRLIQIMCRRWGQETLNKTFKWDHRMDYTPGYVADVCDEQPWVENPKMKETKKRKTQLVSQLNHLRVKFAQITLAETKEEINWSEIKEKNKDLCAEMDQINAQLTLLNIEIDKLSKEVRYDEAHDGKQLMEFDYEKKRVLDGIKIFTYMMEKKMCQILSRYYDNPKDIYSLLAMIVRRGGDVQLERNKLNVRLRQFRDLDVDYVARHLCEDLNQMNPCTFDKLCVPIHYEVAQMNRKSIFVNSREF